MNCWEKSWETSLAIPIWISALGHKVGWGLRNHDLGMEIENIGFGFWGFFLGTNTTVDNYLYSIIYSCSKILQTLVIQVIIYHY